MTPEQFGQLLQTFENAQNTQAFINEQGLAMLAMVAAFALSQWMTYRREQRQAAQTDAQNDALREIPTQIATMTAAISANGMRIEAVERHVVRDIEHLGDHVDRIDGHTEEGKRVVRHNAARIAALEAHTCTTPPPAEPGIPLDMVG